ncbi:Hypothetical protein CpMEX30_1745 [Corynebacterium pseudotuberculosis]|nr:Hypothetical protein CpMEX30_1745 [Corynebacterium pseudotuberculosis]
MGSSSVEGDGGFVLPQKNKSQEDLHHGSSRKNTTEQVTPTLDHAAANASSQDKEPATPPETFDRKYVETLTRGS